ncbi:hypothetical protein ACFSL4_11980 [Streptomyces caeni]|uniref:Uncharacterized protein n=1 Tax=Streptomyces caeni TaxID=2307231 RepID=A0ABW4INK2_9ACTN
MRLQIAQPGGDPGASLREAFGERLDVHGRVARQGLDVHGQRDGDQRQLRVLGQVVADHREAGGVAGVVVGDAVGAPAGTRAWIRPGVGFVGGYG